MARCSSHGLVNQPPPNAFALMIGMHGHLPDVQRTLVHLCAEEPHDGTIYAHGYRDCPLSDQRLVPLGRSYAIVRYPFKARYLPKRFATGSFNIRHQMGISGCSGCNLVHL
jgi:hypothetical protein